MIGDIRVCNPLSAKTGCVYTPSRGYWPRASEQRATLGPTEAIQGVESDRLTSSDVRESHGLACWPHTSLSFRSFQKNIFSRLTSVAYCPKIVSYSMRGATMTICRLVSTSGIDPLRSLGHGLSMSSLSGSLRLHLGCLMQELASSLYLLDPSFRTMCSDFGSPLHVVEVVSSMDFRPDNLLAMSL